MSPDVQQAETVVEAIQTTVAPPLAPVPETVDPAVFSVGLGLLGLIGWMLPILGIPMAATGLVLGWRALGSARRRLAILGSALCVVVLVLAVMNAGVNVYVAETGRQLVDPKVVKALLAR